MINQSGEIIYASNGCSDDQSSDHQDLEFNNNNNMNMNMNNPPNIIEGYIINNNNNEDNNLEMNLRRRKGKIISCAKETFENASRHIRRRVPYAGHLMTPRRLWLNKIPTQCDVVIEFPGDAPDDALRWLLSRIRSQPPIGLGLQANVKAHESTKRTAFYISAPFNILHKAAEEARLPKRLRSDLGGALREFTTRESHCFQQIKSSDDGTSALFTSQERQWLVLQVLQGLRAGTSDLMALQGKAAVFEGQSIVAAWQETGIITQIFPLHETSALTKLQLNWVRKLFAAQPLDDIAEYFGVKVALYFAWLGHYTCALGVPAIFGTILWAGLWGRGETAQDMGHVLFSLFNVAWASLYLEAWRRYSVELAFRWGTLSTPPELLEPPRPLYKGPLVESSVTGRLEPKEAPAWQRRAFRYFVSFPIIGLCLALVFVVMFLMLRLQDWTDDTLPESGIISCLSVIPKVLLAGAITLMDEAYYKLAVWLNDKENYRLQSKYENHLIAKVALFQFVNSFLSLFYIAFYLCDQEKLKEQLAGLLISRQIIGNLRESAFPYVMEQLKLAKLSFSMWGALSPTQETSKLSQLSSAETISSPPQSINIETTSASNINNTNNNEKIEDEKKLQDRKDSKDSTDTPKRSIGQAEIESSLYKYDGTFADHLEMLVQMGYVVLFSAAFPLAGVCAICNNLLEIRSDAFKLAHVHQRPFGQRVANIGTWQNALGILGLAAVIVNCALIGLSGQVSRLWPGLTSTQTIILIVALEHIMLGLRSALTWLLPELPSWLAAEIARAEHCRREMQCKGTTPRPTPPSPPSTTSMQSHPDNNEQATDVDCNIESNHDTQSIESQLADDIIFHHIAPISPKFRKFDDLHTQLLNNSSSIEADVSIRRRHGLNKDITPDSPILSHPIHMPARTYFQDSLTPPQSLLDHHQPLSGNSMQSIPVEIPPYSGSPSTSSTSSSFRITSQPIKIPEIPPFRKNQNQNQNLQKIHSSSQSSSSSTSVPSGTTAAAAAASSTTATNNNNNQQSQSPIADSQQTKTRNIAEIPAYKPRKSNDWQPQSIENDNQQRQHQHHHHQQQQQRHQKQLQLPLLTGTSPTKSNVGVIASSSSGGGGGGHGSGPEWVRRLKGDHQTSSSSSVIHRSIDCIVNKDLATSSDTDLLQMKGAPSWSNVAAIRNDSIPLSIGSSSAPTTTGITLDEEAKAAELAAKKSRVKQSLIKRARSVAIFSLKLKERRAKEAEKAALAAVEHAKAMAPPAPPGGELDLIGIEQLIQIDDVIQHKNPSSGIGSTL